MTYAEPVFRPPAEAGSLIVQLTEGCSYNRCTFCPMYKNKPFRLRSPGEFEAHLAFLQKIRGTSAHRAFIGDGDPLTVSTDRILRAIRSIREYFPSVRKLGIYGSVFSLRGKNDRELAALRDQGLKYVYLGLESGDEEVLRRVDKYTSRAEMIRSGIRVLKARLVLSATVVIGLGGRDRSERHILASAELVNRIGPTHISLLRLMLSHTSLVRDPNHRSFSDRDYRREVGEFVRRVTARTIFRADHASNLIPLRGILPRDRDRLLTRLGHIS